MIRSKVVVDWFMVMVTGLKVFSIRTRRMVKESISLRIRERLWRVNG
jgi:hypothetical protein